MQKLYMGPSWNKKKQVNVGYWRRKGCVDVQICHEKDMLRCKLTCKKGSLQVKLYTEAAQRRKRAS